MLRIANSLTLPIEAVTQTFAILAKRRAGKSFTARKLAEQFLRNKQQIVIVDPKGDTWGIRSGADGKTPGYPVIILGGEHGDLPLEPTTGEVVAKLVVEERASILLDLSGLRKNEVARFMGGAEGWRGQGFLEAVYRLKAREQFRSPVMLIVDEADAIAPQRPFKGEERMLGAIEDIVRRGGQRGIGCTLVSQRSAVLNKNVLTQSQVLVAMRTIAPQDLDAINAWIDVHGTDEERKVLKATLPSLPVGDAWFWSPGWPTDAGIFKRVHVDPIETFDSGATPKPGEKRTTPKNLADIDLGVLQRQMAETIEKAKADDPNALRQRIRELEGELRKKPAAEAAPKADLEAIVKKSVQKALREQQRVLASHLNKLPTILAEATREHLKNMDFDVTNAMISTSGPLVEVPAPRVSFAPSIQPRPAAVQQPKLNGASHSSDQGSVKGIQRKILTILAQFPEGMNIDRLAILSGYTVNGHFNNTLGELRSREWITPARSNPIQITAEGLTALGHFEPLPTGEDLRNYWLSRVGSSKGRILQSLFEAYGQPIELAELAARSGYTVNGHFNNMLGELRTMGLVTPARTPLGASPDLF